MIQGCIKKKILIFIGIFFIFSSKQNHINSYDDKFIVKLTKNHINMDYRFYGKRIHIFGKKKNNQKASIFIYGDKKKYLIEKKIQNNYHLWVKNKKQSKVDIFSYINVAHEKDELYNEYKLFLTENELNGNYKDFFSYLQNHQNFNTSLIKTENDLFSTSFYIYPQNISKFYKIKTIIKNKENEIEKINIQNLKVTYNGIIKIINYLHYNNNKLYLFISFTVSLTCGYLLFVFIFIFEFIKNYKKI